LLLRFGAVAESSPDCFMHPLLRRSCSTPTREDHDSQQSAADSHEFCKHDVAALANPLQPGYSWISQYQNTKICVLLHRLSLVLRISRAVGNRKEIGEGRGAGMRLILEAVRRLDKRRRKEGGEVPTSRTLARWGGCRSCCPFGGRHLPALLCCSSVSVPIVPPRNKEIIPFCTALPSTSTLLYPTLRSFLNDFSKSRWALQRVSHMTSTSTRANSVNMRSPKSPVKHVMAYPVHRLP